jgi:hypothetical protein
MYKQCIGGGGDFFFKINIYQRSERLNNNFGMFQYYACKPISSEHD